MKYRGFKTSATMDQATLTLFSELPFNVNVYSSDDICMECPLVYRGLLGAKDKLKLTFNTAASNTLYIKEIKDGQLFCRQEEWLTEYGNYSLHIKNTSDGKVVCFLPELLGYIPHNTTEIVPSILLYLVSLFTALYIIHFLIRRRNMQREALLPLVRHSVEPSKGSTQRSPKADSERIWSLDVFRGLTTALMVFVNSGGGGYWFFSHSVWDGMTFADIAHPWFNWIMGMSIALSGNLERQKGLSALQRVQRIIPRISKMIILGFIVSAVSFTSNTERIPTMGVLQDLASLYFVVAMLEIFLPLQRTLFVGSKFRDKSAALTTPWSLAYEAFLLWDRWLVMLVSLIVHLGITFGIDVPGCGRGYLGPGGKHQNSKFQNCTGGGVAYVDKAILGSHMMFYLPFSAVYSTNLLHDGYGPVGLFNQLAQVYLGTMAGHILLLHRRNWKLVVYKWLCLGIVLITTAWCLCNDIFNLCVIPINKSLWSLSFILLTSGIAFIVISVLYCTIDVAKKWTGTPFFYPGCNSVVLFVGQIITRQTFPFGWPTKRSHAHLLFLSLWQTCTWIAISVIMYRNKLFLRL